jgi:hypothetical protein
MERLCFIKDDEVLFGRLQPYVGIGPGITDLFDNADAAKNFGIDGPIGWRFMIRKNLSMFAEFKINHQFAVELEHSKLKNLPSGPMCNSLQPPLTLPWKRLLWVCASIFGRHGNPALGL